MSEHENLPESIGISKETYESLDALCINIMLSHEYLKDVFERLLGTPMSTKELAYCFFICGKMAQFGDSRMEMLDKQQEKLFRKLFLEITKNNSCNNVN